MRLGGVRAGDLVQCDVKAGAFTPRWPGAIGRYVETFSHLVFAMRSSIENRLMGGGNGYHLVQLALEEAPTAQLANSLFGMCSEAMLEHDDDRKITRMLKKNVLEEISRRNDIAHGDWW